MRIIALICSVLPYLSSEGLCQFPPQLAPTNYSYMQATHNTGVGINSALSPFGDMVSDGTGHHYVIPTANNEVRHYRFNNFGGLIDSSTFGSSAARPCITSRNGLIHVVLHNTNSNKVELFESVNGGVSWTNTAFQSVSGVLDGIDAYEDFRGVHIVYSSNTGIYYHMRDVVSGTWATYTSTVYNGGATNSHR